MNCKYCDSKNISRNSNGLVTCMDCSRINGVEFRKTNSLEEENGNKKREREEESEEEEEEIMTDPILFASFARKKKGQETEKVKKNSNVMDYDTIKESVEQFVNARGSLKDMEDDKKQLLIKGAINVLHHCSIVWSKALGSKECGMGTFQLPKDCNLRISTCLYYILHMIPSLLKGINLGTFLDECSRVSNGIAAGIKNILAYGKFLKDLLHFAGIIQSRYFGGSGYKKLLEADEAYSSISHEPMICELISPTIYFYENLFHGFFDNYPLYEAFRKQALENVRIVEKSVVLDGKGRRNIQMVSIFATIKRMALRDIVTRIRERAKSVKVKGAKYGYKDLLKILHENSEKRNN